MRKFTDLDAAKAFHGHLGPNLVIGMKLGNLALDALDARPYFGMTVELRCPAGPPVSCVIDGVQLATGCTMGKANLVHFVSDGPVKAVFTNIDNGKRVLFEVKAEAIEKYSSLVKQLGEEDASRLAWEADDAEIFIECSD